jgi:uncharacterized membrane protein
MMMMFLRWLELVRQCLMEVERIERKILINLKALAKVVSIVLSIDFIVCFACVVLWVGVNTWVLVVYRMAGFMS